MLPKLFLLLFVVLASYTAAIEHVHNGVETEMFAIPISPNLFNWTYQEFDQQYRFHASMENKPELPPFLRYIYSGRHHSGFIFGTPPRGIKSPIRLQIVGLNRQDYETRRVTIVLNITPKTNMARHEVAFKIDNLNAEDLLDEHKMTRLKDILRMKLWTESSDDLYPTFLASAIDLGARLPLRPGDGEGLVVRLGSKHPFSTELKRLREEVRPLSRLPSCPREYKRTTVERLFRDAGLTLDWCQFELYNTIYTERGTEHLEYLTELPKKSSKDHHEPIDSTVWNAPSKSALPLRSYTTHLAVTIAAPLVLMVLSVAALTAVLCFHYAGMRDPESEWFLSNIFHICTDRNHRRSVHNAANVEICRYGTNVTEQTQLGGNDSRRSIGPSPNNSIGHVRSYSPKSNANLTADYIRPQPPPYAGGGNLHHRRSGNTDRTTPSTSGHTPEHRGHLALEESLQLLNEAKITTDFDPILKKDPVIDYADTTDDYVPVQPAISGFNPMVADLDDINVPELSKYGIGAQI